MSRFNRLYKRRARAMNASFVILLSSVVIIGFISLFGCFVLIKYINLSVKYKELENYIVKVAHLINSARYGNLYSRIKIEKEPLIVSELSKNINSLLESIIDRDIMINEYVEKEKEETNLKEEFIATLTHDLKVPIIAQDNTIDLFLYGKFGEISDVQKEVMKKLKISNTDLKYLVESLLETYKAENSGLSIKYKNNVPVKKFVLETIDQLSSIFELHNKKIIFKTSVDDIYCADMDTFLVKRVLNNLILNALSYSLNSDTIEAYLSGNDKDFSISIKDYGAGIEEEEINKIFNKYYTGKLKSMKSSTGLGLYLSNKIITAMKGKITVESEINKGSAFTVTLPLKSS